MVYLKWILLGFLGPPIKVKECCGVGVVDGKGVIHSTCQNQPPAHSNHATTEEMPKLHSPKLSASNPELSNKFCPHLIGGIQPASN
jgi:hypothetical protein